MLPVEIRASRFATQERKEAKRHGIAVRYSVRYLRKIVYI